MAEPNLFTNSVQKGTFFILGQCGALAALLLFSPLSVFGAVTLSVGPNINITKSLKNNAEECIAINPVNPLNLFASETWTLDSKYSTDGGVTWHNSDVSAVPGSDGDVSAAFDNFGNLFLAQFGTSFRVAVGLSTNGGASFSLLYQTPDGTNDQPTVTTGPGSVWISYTTPTDNFVARGAAVTGLGAVGSFSSAQTAAPTGDFGDIAVGPSGQMMVAYQNQYSGIGPDTINVNLDADGLGAGGFGSTIDATTTQVGAFVPIPAQPQREIDAEAGLAWDRTGGPHDGRVYLLYTDRPSTSSFDTDIYVRYSDDNGSTWSSPVRVNDDPLGNGKSQFLPRIALDQTSGNIAASWYDCRNSPDNNTVEVWATVSTDGGQTFLPNVKVSAGVSSALVPAISNTTFDYGDYTGLAFHAGTFYPCWADNSNSTGDNPAGAMDTFDMYTARVTVNVPLVLVNPRFTNSTFHVSVPTVAATTYYLESTLSVKNPSWTTSATAAGDGTLKELIDPSASAPSKLYRVRAQ